MFTNNEKVFNLNVCPIPDLIKFSNRTSEFILEHMNSIHRKPNKPFKSRVADLMAPVARHDRVINTFDKLILALILLNVLAVVLETVKFLNANYGIWFFGFEIFSMVFFTTEYLLRLWACTTSEKYRDPVKGRIRYAITPMMLLDLLAILPFYLSTFFAVDLRFIRAFRLFRLLVVLKLVRYSRSLKLFIQVGKEKKEELLVTFSMIIFLLIFASCIIYFLENEVQPDAFSSIPASMWWGVATMTTVGYGDIYPITPLGKVFGGLIAILGLGMFGLPAAILATGFLEELQKGKDSNSPNQCPHCGETLEC